VKGGLAYFGNTRSAGTVPRFEKEYIFHVVLPRILAWQYSPFELFNGWPKLIFAKKIELVAFKVA
jgi:hypothetical protein